MLLSAKVNQWTLLVGSLWVAYTLGGGGGAPLPLDDRQTEEFLLTSAQALLAFAVLADLRFGVWEAVAVFALFVLQFPFPTTDVRLVFSLIYVVVAVALLVHRRRYLPGILRASGAGSGRRKVCPRSASRSAIEGLTATQGRWTEVGPFSRLTRPFRRVTLEPLLKYRHSRKIAAWRNAFVPNRLPR